MWHDLLVRNDVPDPPEEIFEAFSSEPIAAASLGQVQEATIQGRKRVAVKIQYPGIRDAISERRKVVSRNTTRAVTGHIPKEAIDEVQKQFLAQTDYKREVGNIDSFKRSHGAQLVKLTPF